MNIHRVHVDYWMAKRGLPRFADHLRRPHQFADPATMIHQCVNAHACKRGSIGVTHGILDANNTMSLLKHVRERGGDLLEYLQKLAIDPGTIINPRRRAGFARKWANRIIRQRSQQ